MCYKCGKVRHLRVNCPQRKRDTKQRYGLISSISNKDFDVILGVDWLTEHRAMIDFWRHRFTLNVQEGGMI